MRLRCGATPNWRSASASPLRAMVAPAGQHLRATGQLILDNAFNHVTNRNRVVRYPAASTRA